MAIIDDFKTRFPEFDSGLVDNRLPSLIEEYRCFYNFDYDDCQKTAILYLLAHMMTGDSSSSSAASMGIGSKSVGSVSVSYQSGGSSTDRSIWLNSSKYGQRFLMLTANRIGARFV